MPLAGAHVFWTAEAAPALFLEEWIETTQTKQTMWSRLSALFQAQDMTVGKPFICLLKFSLPMLIGNFAQMLYNTVDSIVVGKYIGDAALSAIGRPTAAKPFPGILYGHRRRRHGHGRPVLRRPGDRQPGEYHRQRHFPDLPVLSGHHRRGDAADPGHAAVHENAAGDLRYGQDLSFHPVHRRAGNGFYNVLSGVLRGLGEALFPFIVLVCTSLLNVGLDLWFVAGLNMGIAGAAWATIISQVLSSVVCLIKSSPCTAR
jgi:hypothetical protein